MPQGMDKIRKYVGETSEKWGQAHPDKPHPHTDEDLNLVTNLGGIALIMTEILESSKSKDPVEVADFARSLFKLREVMLEIFPRPTESVPCPLCRINDRKEGEPCLHKDIIRVAIVGMAMLRITPDVDLDVLAELDAEGEKYHVDL